MIDLPTDSSPLPLQEQYNLLVSAFGDIIYVHDVRLDTITWSGRFEDILGYTQREMGSTGASWTDKVHPDDLPRVLEEFERAEKENKRFEFEYRFKKKDNTYIWMHDVGNMKLGNNHSAVWVIGVLRDISQKRSSEAQLREKVAELERLNTLMVGRELKMVELKHELAACKRKLAEAGS